MSTQKRTIPIVLVIGFFAAGSLAQPELVQAGTDPLPTLDELLGLQEQGSGSDPNDEKLDEILSPREAGEALGQAIDLMDRVAQRIDTESDISITTQRLQEDILRKLDQVIESANNNQQGGGGGSSSSQSSSSSNQQQPNQQQQQGDSQQQGAPGSESGQESMPGGSSTASPGDALAPDGVSWGALPQRVRDALSQGFSDKYSELYRTLTEEYYRALAEDENP